jgi:MFS family permease
MISNFTMGERSAPAAKVGTAMTLLAAATGLGYAVGSAVAGRLADDHGHTAAFAVTVSAAAGALLLSLASQRLLRRPAAPHHLPLGTAQPSSEVSGSTAGVVHA